MTVPVFTKTDMPITTTVRDSNTARFVRIHRKKMGLSQAQLAKRLGYKTAATITNIETSKVLIPKFMAMDIAKVLNCDVNHLIAAIDKDVEEHGWMTKIYK